MSHTMSSANANATAVQRSSSAPIEPVTTGSSGARQMEVDNQFEAHCAQSSKGRATPAVANQAFVEQELIPPTSRLSRLPVTVPSSPHTLSSHPAPVAIPAFQNNNTTYTSQDVHRFVNSSTSQPSSTAPRTFGQSSTPLETFVSSSSQPLSNHVLTHPIRRPRTSNIIFQSPTDLAAHYGIPQILPPAPRTQHKHQTVQQQQPALPDFQTLSANYLNMLSKQPTDSSMAAPSKPTMSTITPEDLEAPVIPADEPSSGAQNFEDFFASPAFTDGDDFMNLFTPSMPDLDEFGTSPLDTPFHDFLSTPLFADEAMLTSPSMEFLDDRPLFGGIDYSKAEEVPIQSKAPQPQVEQQQLYTISPNLESPFLDFEAHSFPVPQSTAAPAPTTGRAKTPAPARRSKATGIRKGITPDLLLDEDAPTQPRKYTLPSSTSRKEVPDYLKRKRARSTAFGDEDEDEDIEPLPPNATEEEQILHKRRQNTVAARRSRKRKLEQFQRMEHELEEAQKKIDIWKTRALTMQAQLQAIGAVTYNFTADDDA